MDEPKFSAEYRAAFEKCALPFYKDIFHIAYIKTQNIDDADLLTQETYLKAYQKFDTLNDTSKARPWLASILHSLYLDRQKRCGNTELVAQWEKFEDAITDIPQVAKTTFAADEEKQIEKVLDLLPQIQRELIYYKYVKNLQLIEIAQMYGKSIDAVKSALAQARENLMRMRHNP